jgi:hypothetical protein
MANLGWRAQVTFLLAGAIFVLCHMIMTGTRSADVDAGYTLAGDRGADTGRAASSAVRLETDGRALAPR